MNKKYITTFVLALSVVIGWNAFLIQRDAKLFEAYNQTQVR
jgi:hypothetical protein